LPFREEKEELEITKRPPSSGPAHLEPESTGRAGIHIDLHPNRHFDNLRRSPFHVVTSVVDDQTAIMPCPTDAEGQRSTTDAGEMPISSAELRLPSPG
jgi:hypothetical protein